MFIFHISLRPVCIICTALFLSEVTVHYLLHSFLDNICLFTRGAILLGIQLAPLSEDEDIQMKSLRLFLWLTRLQSGATCIMQKCGDAGKAMVYG